MKPVRVLIVDDSASMRALIRATLSTDRNISVVGEANCAFLPAKAGLGESDLRADLGADYESPTMDACRARVIIVSRAAGLMNPCQSVFPEPRDSRGLLLNSQYGRQLGFMGRMAIHPAQVPIINNVYTPKSGEIEDAREICEAASLAAGQNKSVVITEAGKIVAPPVVARAMQLLRLAHTLNLIEGVA